MANGIIIAGFATCGKSFLGKKYSNVIDLESSNYRYDNSKLENIPIEARKGTKREINEEWPYNYYKAIDEAVKKYDVVLVQLKPEHLEYFDKNNIKYSIAYPNINDWESVRKKCIDRGNRKSFIEGLKNVFIPFYEDCLQRNYENLYIINKNETLESVLIKNNIELKIYGNNDNSIDIKLPAEFIDKIVNRNGLYGCEWLKSINDIINKYQKKFQLKNIMLEKNLSINIVLTAYCEEYGDVVMKIGKPNSIKSEINFFKLCNSKYMVKCYYYNYEDGVILLEKINPGYSLNSIDNINDRLKLASTIINEIIIKDFDQNIDYKRYSEVINSKINDEKICNSLDSEIKKMIERAQEYYSEIVQMNLKEYILHHDLHYKNILKGKDDWEVIDPHGIIGYKVFEASQVIRAELNIVNNDISKLQDIVLNISNYLNEDINLIYKSLYVDTIEKILFFISAGYEKQYIDEGKAICNEIIKYVKE